VAGHPEPILHVDMDAFYASIEQHDDPALAGRPVAVGAPSGRGVVAAASYEARAFGVASAMPMVRARRLCPDLVVVAPRFDRYHEVSGRLRTILTGFTPLVEPLALDEAFLDVAGAVQLFGDPPAIGEAIRHEVRRELGLPCSVGVGPTKSVAKLLSARAKPDGLLHWPVDEVPARLRPLPVSALWGAGPRTVERLTVYGLRTIGDVADADVRTLVGVVGDALGRQLHALARGIDPRPVVVAEPARTVSSEATFARDVDDPEVLARRLLRLADEATARMRRQGLAARTVGIKVRLADFSTVTRAHTLDRATDRTHDVVGIAMALLDALRLERARVRLLGVRLSNLGAPEVVEQLRMFAVDASGGAADGSGAQGPRPDPHRWQDVDRAADAIAERYGRGAVGFAALLDDEAGDDDGTGPDPDR
jgi:DNA polymerase IV